MGVSRLSRAELQLRNRAKVLAAARAEFAEHGYRDATIDRIADRADLTRGAVYSNFPGKRALYFTALTEPTPVVSNDAANRPAGGGLAGGELGGDRPAGGGLARGGPAAGELAGGGPAGSGRLAGVGPAGGAPAGRGRVVRRANAATDGLAAFAAAWFDQEHPGPDVVPELAEIGTQYAELLGLNALLLGLSLDQLSPGRLGRLIRAARVALTLLTGATQLTAAPGFVQPLAIAKACGELVALDLDDPWIPPPTTPPVRPAHEPWSPPDVTDEVLRRTAVFDSGVVAILGLNRLAAAEDVVRSTAGPVTIALVSSHPDELGPLARYTTGSLLACLRQSAPLPRIQLVHDERGVLASALGCEVIGDDLEYAASIAGGRIVARAEGFGAGTAITRPLDR